MKKTFTACLLLCLAAGEGLAQSDFRPGYVVLSAGDTLRGQVDYRERARSAESCRYRPGPAGSVTDYTPGQLRGYGLVGGSTYETCVVPLDPDVLGNQLTQRLFLEVVTKGALILYHRADNMGRSVFYLATPTAPTAPVTELQHRRAGDVTTGVASNREDNRFRGALSMAFAACPTARMKVGTVPYTRQGLLAAVRRYNDCVQPPATATQPLSYGLRRSRLLPGVLVGAEKSHYYLNEAARPIKGELDGEWGLAAGLGLSWQPANISERLLFRLEALYEQQQYEGAVENQSGLVYAGARAAIKTSYLRVPLLLRYTRPGSRIKPFVQGGISFATLLTLEQSYQYRYQINGQDNYTPARPITSDERRYELGPVLALGAQLPELAGRALQLEVRAEGGGGFVTYDSFDNYVLRYYFLLGYNLTK